MDKVLLIERINDIYNTFKYDFMGKSGGKQMEDFNFMVEHFEEIKELQNENQDIKNKFDNICKRVQLCSADIMGYHVQIEKDCYNMTVQEFIEYANKYDRNSKEVREKLIENMNSRIDFLSKKLK